MNTTDGQSRPITVRPAALTQFAPAADTFCLVTDDDLSARFVFPDDSQQRCMIVRLGPGEDLAQVLARDIPAEADVLVICRHTFLTSPTAGQIGPGRRLAIMPCASTPVTSEHVRYFLSAAERTDPMAQEKQAASFFEHVANAEDLRIVDTEHGTVCEFDPLADDYEWNQQAGSLGRGEQQIMPSGELSVLPMEITDFSGERSLALNGVLTLRGWPIVHAGYDPALAGRQQRLYERLVPLHRHPVRLRVRDGIITGYQDSAHDGEAADIVAALDELFAAEPRYRIIWELGFGLNTEMSVVPANCGLNEPYGATNGVIHLGIGLTPYTEFALTFLCPSSTLDEGAGQTIIGGSGRTAAQRRRITPVRRAGCGCTP